MAQGLQGHGYQALPRRDSGDGARGEVAQSAGAEFIDTATPPWALPYWQGLTPALRSSAPMPAHWTRAHARLHSLRSQFHLAVLQSKASRFQNSTRKM